VITNAVANNYIAMHMQKFTFIFKIKCISCSSL